MRIGNVIRDPEGEMWIVTDVGDYVVEAVSFDSENCSAICRLADYDREETCPCGDHPDFAGEPQTDCQRCHGSGSYTKKILGWRHSKILAPNCKTFILNSVKRQFEL